MSSLRQFTDKICLISISFFRKLLYDDTLALSSATLLLLHLSDLRVLVGLCAYARTRWTRQQTRYAAGCLHCFNDYALLWLHSEFFNSISLLFYIYLLLIFQIPVLHKFHKSKTFISIFGVLIIVFIILAATPAGFPFKKDVAAQRYYVLVNSINLFKPQIV